MDAHANYRTVFDISQKGFDWWFSAAGIVFILIGIFLIWLGRRNHWPFFRKVIPYFMVIFAVLWSVATFTVTYSEYSQLRTAYRNGEFAVVEGTVVNFQPMPYEGHRDECFSVASQTFCYSDFGVSAGFNNSASHGGPIREGLPVRVSYVGDTIVRLEVREDALASDEQRKNYSKLAEAESQKRQEQDPVLNHINLGFGIAIVFVTSWWNIQWNRFMRFWIKPPYKPLTVILFRLFFVANLVGAVGYLFQQCTRSGLHISDYLTAAEIGAAMIVASWIVITIVERINQHRYQ